LPVLIKAGSIKEKRGGAYWHHDFGQVRSHGCINLEPSDAEWLFDWTGPVLPEGASQLMATKGNPGTIVQVIE